MKKTLDVFYVTYLHDLEWFQWSIFLLNKHLSGFRKIVAVAPIQDAAIFSKFKGIEWHFIEDWPERNYFWQQWVKMNANTYTDAEYILHIDSDVMVTEPCDCEDFFVGGSPVWLYQSYASLGDKVPWQKFTESAYRKEVGDEYMRGFPFVLRSDTHLLSQRSIRSLHGMEPERFLKGVEGFSEFNFMGAVARQHQEMGYIFYDVEKEFPPHTKKFRQFWSHDPIEKFDSDLHGYSGTPIRILTDFGVWVLSGDSHLSKWIKEHKRLDFDVYFLEQICSHIKPDDVVLDIGAFVGDHTLAYANVASSGKVIAVEPNPLAFECLSLNMANFPNVEVLNMGLSSVPGKATLNTGPNYGGAFLEEGGDIRVGTIDDMKLEKLDFIKIDAEGYETKILMGAMETLRKFRPKMMIEVNEGALERQNSSSSELRDMLSYLKYDVASEHLGLQYDILCTPRELPVNPDKGPE
jgi:FkbM family methyltransferase